MLVLSRRVGESIVIGNEVTVTVLEVRGDQIRVGIDAPRHVQVHREEVFRQLEAENTSAADAARRTQRLVARLPQAAANRQPPPGRPGVARPSSGGPTGAPGGPTGAPAADDGDASPRG